MDTDFASENYAATKAAIKAKMEDLARKLEVLAKYEALKQEVAAIQSELGGGASPEKNSSQSLFTVDFASLKKAAAAARVILDNGEGVSLPSLFQEMKKRGHPVKNANSLRAMLVREKDEKGTFTNANALWDLTQKGRASYGG
ncbi:hypothetical protein [Prosthecobacter sp.]|uniref:hypothetical protein n=1 Tax=Prosthecobacter sp. TaxID=1965333 RepID=UPI00378337D9